MIRQRRLFQLELGLSDLKRKAVGAAGEWIAYNLLEESGYAVAMIGRGDRRGDLMAINRETGEVWRIEVKTARRTRTGWQFLLRKNDKHGRTDCSDSDVVILLAILKSGRAVPFVIPVAAIGTRKMISFRSHPEVYAGQWAQYRQKRKLTLEGVGQDGNAQFA